MLSSRTQNSITFQFTVSQCDRQIVLDMIDTYEQRRTVEEFCSTQECAGIKDDVGHMTVNGQLEEIQSESFYIVFWFFSKIDPMFCYILSQIRINIFGLNLLDFQQ